MGIKKSYLPNQTTISAGARFYPDHVNDDGTKPVILVAFAGDANPQWKLALERARRDGVKSDTLDTQVELYRKTLINVGIKGWENVYDDEEKPIPFTTANVEKLLSDLPWLYQDISAFSIDRKNYISESPADVVKNLQPVLPTV